MQAKVTVEGEYIAPDSEDSNIFAIDSGNDGLYWFHKDHYTPELDAKWAAGTLLEAGGFIWVVMVSSAIYDDGEDDRGYYVYRCNQLGVPPGTSILRYRRSDFATTFPGHRVLYQVTGERTK